MTTREIGAFPAGENPYWHDSYRMGMPLGKNVEVMFDRHPSDFQEYVILVDKTTGKRLEVQFAPESDAA